MSLFVVYHLEQSESDVRFLKFHNNKVKESIGSIPHLTHYENEGVDMPFFMPIYNFFLLLLLRQVLIPFVKKTEFKILIFLKTFFCAFLNVQY